MIAIFIFTLHVIAVVYVFAKGCVDHKVSEGFINILFVSIIFSVGWTIAGFLVKVLLPPKGFGVWLDSDTLSLLVVTILELILYSLYFWRRADSHSPARAE